MKPRPHAGTSATAAAIAVTGAAMLAPQAVAAESENIVIGTTDSVTTVDPAKCCNFWCASVVLENVAETLVTYAPGEVELSPLLAAELPEISDDGLTYTFRLREGVTFHDGSKMTAEDVRFSLDRARWINHPEGASFLLSGIDSIETPDDHTVKIHLEAPDITFASRLAFPVAPILPSGAYPSPEEPLPKDAPVAVKEKYIQERAWTS